MCWFSVLFLKQWNNWHQHDILATDVKMLRKELEYGSLSEEAVSYQIVALCFENNENDFACVMFFVTQVLKNWFKRNHYRLDEFFLCVVSF